MLERIDWSIGRGLQVADQEIEAFRSVILGKSFTSVIPLPSSAQQVFRADVGGVLSILRVVRHVRASVSVRHANAFHRLARALSPHRMSSPAVLTRFTRAHSGVPANTDIVVIEHAPLTYEDGEKVTRDILRGVGGEHRHLGAFLSYITHLADHGLRRNLLFSKNQSHEFPFWFIDLDFAFGARMRWGHAKSLFFPPRGLNYQAKGYAASPPAHAAELLELVGNLPRREVARIFGLSNAEANDLQARCCKVRQLGLAAAIECERFWGPKDGFLTRWKEMAYAKLTKPVIALVVFLERQLGLGKIADCSETLELLFL
jgi:hypothetical protein